LPLSYIDLISHKQQIKNGILNIFEYDKKFIEQIKSNKISKRYLKRLVLS
jgi:hypothetical protein